MTKGGRGGAPGGERRVRPEAAQDATRSPEEMARQAAYGQDLSEAYASTQGATAGAERGPDRRTIRREERDNVDAAAVASFTKELADMAGGDPADNAQDRQEPGFESEEDYDLQVEEDVDIARPARKESAGFGGDDEPEGTNDGATAGPTPPAPPVVAKPVARVKPKARARHVALDDCLRAGAGAGILIGYQAELLHRVLPRLTSAAWLLLNEALAKVDTELAAAFVLKALAAHRHAQQLPAFAEHVADLGDRKAVAVHLEMGPVPPLDGLEPRALRLHYDPIESLGAGSKSRVSEGFSVQPWPLPMWLRGIPRAPLEMATVAVDQALSNDLRPAERTSGGASDALTAALAPHAETHPSLGRWLLNLCARADSHSGLVHMREAMMRARVEMTR